MAALRCVSLSSQLSRVAAPRNAVCKVAVSRRVAVISRAGEESKESTPAPPAPPSPAAPQSPSSTTEAGKAVKAPLIKEGDDVAIITGGISVIFGVLYLGLVYVMEGRGGTLLPPPPEAFIP